MPRKPQSPTQRREALEATAGRAAQEKDERVVADANQNTSIGNLGTRMGFTETLNANQTALLQSHTADIVALGTRITNQENVNIAQQANIVDLLGFRNRAAGFAALSHEHDERYYGRGTTDTWFLRTTLHPLGVQLHGPGYHA